MRLALEPRHVATETADVIAQFDERLPRFAIIAPTERAFVHHLAVLRKPELEPDEPLLDADERRHEDVP